MSQALESDMNARAEQDVIQAETSHSANRFRGFNSPAKAQANQALSGVNAEMPLRRSKMSQNVVTAR